MVINNIVYKELKKEEEKKKDSKRIQDLIYRMQEAGFLDNSTDFQIAKLYKDLLMINQLNY